MKKNLYLSIFFLSLPFMAHASDSTIFTANCKNVVPNSNVYQTAQVILDYERSQVFVDLPEYFNPFKPLCLLEENKEFSCTDIFVRRGHTLYIDATFVTVSKVKNNLHLKVEEHTSGNINVYSYDCD